MKSFVQSALKAIFALGFTITCSLQAAAQCSSATCTLVWSDEFDGAALDLSKWQHQIGNGCSYGICNWGNNELQYYRSQNTTVANGLLTIEAREESFGGKNYTSSRIRTLNQGDWKYGRIEMRAKLPANQYGAGQGTWPAFWMLASNSPYGGWPGSGEIDIMEWLGHEPNELFGTLHYDDGDTGSNFSANDGQDTPLPNSLNFHTYAVEWEANEIRWYLDGELYSTKNSWNSDGQPYPAPFDVDFHILLNMAVGGNFPGNPDANSIFPQQYIIDYVRVYEWGGAGGPVTNDPPLEQLVLVDNFEHNNPAANGWDTYGSFSIGNNVSNTPPQNGDAWAMSASSGFGTGDRGGFFRNIIMDLTGITKFSFWINPAAGESYTIFVNIEDDDNGNAQVNTNTDDEFQYDCVVSPTGPCAVAGGGWQKVEIPIGDFYDDNSLFTNGNGVLDTEAGGNGFGTMVNFAMDAGTGSSINFDTDYWAFEAETVVTENVPLPWLALLAMSASLLGIGAWRLGRFTKVA